MEIRFNDNKTQAWFYDERLNQKNKYDNIQDTLNQLEVLFKLSYLKREAHQHIVNQISQSRLKSVSEIYFFKDGEIIISIEQAGKINMIYKKGLHVIESFRVFKKQDAIETANYFLKKFSLNNKRKREVYKNIDENIFLLNK